MTPQMALKANAWNSLCAPLPMMAMVAAPLRARWSAASAEVAAVRNAVRMVISLSSTGYPVARSARTPNAATV